MTDETKPRCPACQSTACILLAHAAHCNQCGADWKVQKVSVPKSTKEHPANGYQNPQFVTSMIPPQKK
jgi:hypothetical protein